MVPTGKDKQNYCIFETVKIREGSKKQAFLCATVWEKTGLRSL